LSGLEKLDDLDLKLLIEYVKDARQSSRHISKKLNVAASTIIERTKRLERKGIIKGYSAVVDYDKAGYELTAVVQVTISNKLPEVERTIAKMPQVVSIYDVTGQTDAIIIAKFKSRKELSDFAKKLLAIRYVERTMTHLALNIIKESLGPAI